MPVPQSYPETSSENSEQEAAKKAKLQEKLQARQAELAEVIEGLSNLDGQITALEEELVNSPDPQEVQADLANHNVVIKGLKKTKRGSPRMKKLDQNPKYTELVRKDIRVLINEKRELEQQLMPLKRQNKELRRLRNEYKRAMSKKANLESRIRAIEKSIENIDNGQGSENGGIDGKKVQIHQSVPRNIPSKRDNVNCLPSGEPVQENAAATRGHVESVARLNPDPSEIKSQEPEDENSDANNDITEEVTEQNPELQEVVSKLKELFRHKTQQKKSLRVSQQELGGLIIEQKRLQKAVTKRNASNEEKERLRELSVEINTVSQAIEKLKLSIEKTKNEIAQVKTQRTRLKKTIKNSDDSEPGENTAVKDQHPIPLPAGGVDGHNSLPEVNPRPQPPEEEKGVETVEKLLNNGQLISIELGQGLTAEIPAAAAAETLSSMKSYCRYLRKRIDAVLKALPDPEKILLRSGSGFQRVSMPIDLELNLVHDDLRAKQLAEFNETSAKLGVVIPKAVQVRDKNWKTAEKKGNGFRSVHPRFVFPPTHAQREAMTTVRTQLNACLDFLSETNPEDNDNPQQLGAVQRQELIRGNIERKKTEIAELEQHLAPLIQDRENALEELREIVVSGHLNTAEYRRKNEQLVEDNRYIEGKEKELQALRESLASLQAILVELDGSSSAGSIPVRTTPVASSQPSPSSEVKNPENNPTRQELVGKVRVSENIEITFPNIETIRSWVSDEPHLCHYLHIRLKAYLLALPDPDKLREQNLWTEKAGSFLLDFQGNRDCLSVGHRKIFKEALREKGISLPSASALRDQWWRKKNPEYYQGQKPKFNPQDETTLQSLQEIRANIQAYINVLADLALPEKVTNIQPGTKVAISVKPRSTVETPAEKIELQLSDQVSAVFPSIDQLRSWLTTEPQLAQRFAVYLRALLHYLPNPEQLQNEDLWDETRTFFQKDFEPHRYSLPKEEQNGFYVALKQKSLTAPSLYQIRRDWWRFDPRRFDGAKPKFDVHDPDTLTRLTQLRELLQSYLEILKDQLPPLSTAEAPQATSSPARTTVPPEYKKIRSSLPGMTKVRIPSVRALKESIKSYRGKKGDKELLIRFLEGYFRALPQLEDPEAAIAGFKGTAFRQVASSPNLQKACLQLGFIFREQHCPIDLFNAWFRRGQKAGERVIKLRSSEKLTQHSEEITLLRRALELRIKLLKGEGVPRARRIVIPTPTPEVPSVETTPAEEATLAIEVPSVNLGRGPGTEHLSSFPEEVSLPEAVLATYLQEVLRQPEVAAKFKELQELLTRALLAQAEPMMQLERAKVIATAEADAAAVVRRKELTEEELQSTEEQLRQSKEELEKTQEELQRAQQTVRDVRASLGGVFGSGAEISE